MRMLTYAVIVSGAFVILSYFGFNWYYGRYDVKPLDLESFERYAPPPTLAKKTQKVLDLPMLSDFNDEGIITEDGEASVITDKEEMQSFTDFVMEHPFTQQPDDKMSILVSQYDAAEPDKRIEIGMEMINYYTSFHDLMNGLLQRYVEHRIPFRVDSDEFAVVAQAVETYIDFVENSDDPFLLKAFKSSYVETDSSPEMIEMRRRYYEWSESN